MNPKTNDTGAVLIIPDIHQDVGFLERILAQEDVTQFKQVVFLGDVFDARDIDHRGPLHAAASARIIARLSRKLGSRLQITWGNHDVPYYVRSAMMGPDGFLPSKAVEALNTLGVRPESEPTFRAVSKEWDERIWKHFTPFVMTQGHLLSHAGIHPSHLSQEGPLEEQLRDLKRRWAKAIQLMKSRFQANQLFMPGEARGGVRKAVGGPTWQDWDLEFNDGLSFPQIVGHTSWPIMRENGSSQCIDYGQSAYGILKDGLVVRGV